MSLFVSHYLSRITPPIVTPSIMQGQRSVSFSEIPLPQADVSFARVSLPSVSLPGVSFPGVSGVSGVSGVLSNVLYRSGNVDTIPEAASRQQRDDHSVHHSHKEHQPHKFHDSRSRSVAYWFMTALILAVQSSFGAGFFFLVNASQHAAFCGVGASMRFVYVVVGVLTAFICDVLPALVLGDGTAGMDSGPLVHVFYVTQSVHLVFASMDSHFTLMLAFYVAAIVATFRYDTLQPVFGGCIAFFACAVKMALDHSLNFEHMVLDLHDSEKCTNYSAIGGLIAGGLWFAHPMLTIMRHRVARLSAKTSHSVCTAGDAWLDMVVPMTIAAIPVIVQVADPSGAWAPMLFANAKFDAFSAGSDDRLYRLLTVALQNVALLASCLLPLQICYAQALCKKRSWFKTGFRAEAHVMTTALALVWGAAMLSVPFAHLSTVYLVTFFVSGFAANGFTWARTWTRTWTRPWTRTLLRHNGKRTRVSSGNTQYTQRVRWNWNS